MSSSSELRVGKGRVDQRPNTALHPRLPPERATEERRVRAAGGGASHGRTLRPARAAPNSLVAVVQAGTVWLVHARPAGAPPAHVGQHNRRPAGQAAAVRGGTPHRGRGRHEAAVGTRQVCVAACSCGLRPPTCTLSELLLPTAGSVAGARSAHAHSLTICEPRGEASAWTACSRHGQCRRGRCLAPRQPQQFRSSPCLMPCLRYLGAGACTPTSTLHSRASLWPSSTRRCLTECRRAWARCCSCHRTIRCVAPSFCGRFVAPGVKAHMPHDVATRSFTHKRRCRPQAPAATEPSLTHPPPPRRLPLKRRRLLRRREVARSQARPRHRPVSPRSTPSPPRSPGWRAWTSGTSSSCKWPPSSRFALCAALALGPGPCKPCITCTREPSP